jgi:hypothetical protein
MAKAGEWMIYGAAVLLLVAFIPVALWAAVYTNALSWAIPVFIPLLVIFVGVTYIRDPSVLGIVAIVPSIAALIVFFLVWQSILQLLGGVLGLLGSILAIVGGFRKGR